MLRQFRPYALIVALALTGCGIKGPLYLPPATNATAPAAPATPPSPAASPNAQGGAAAPSSPAPASPAPSDKRP